MGFIKEYDEWLENNQLNEYRTPGDTNLTPEERIERERMLHRVVRGGVGAAVGAGVAQMFTPLQGKYFAPVGAAIGGGAANRGSGITGAIGSMAGYGVGKAFTGRKIPGRKRLTGNYKALGGVIGAGIGGGIGGYNSYLKDKYEKDHPQINNH